MINLKFMWEGHFWRKGGSGVWIMAALLWMGCHPSHPSRETTKVAVDTVYMHNLKFVPDTLLLHGPTRVVFVNQDIVVHNITQTDSAWASPNLNPGDSWSRMIDRSTHYFCTLHPTMKGVLEVEQ